MTGWRIIFMGTPEFACPALQVLIDRGENIVSVFTQPDRPKGRGQKLQPPPVKELALAHAIPVHQPSKVRVQAVIDQIKELQPDLIVVVAFGQILPKALLEIPSHGCVNVHASLLPRYRGAAPLNWCIVNGEDETGVTTMLMDVGLDTGPMLLKKAMAIAPDEGVVSLHDRMSVLGAELLGDTLDGLKDGSITPEPQDDSQSCYAPLLKKEHGVVNWQASACEIHNKIRGLSVWPGVVAWLDNAPLKLYRSQIRQGEGIAGSVIATGKDGIEVACGQGSLLITELQAAGSRRMDAASFLAGHPLLIGTLLSTVEMSASE